MIRFFLGIINASQILLIDLPKSKVFFLAEPSKEVFPTNLILNRLMVLPFQKNSY